MILMSKRKMRLLKDYDWSNLTDKQKKEIRKNERKEVGCFCKYGYTQCALYQTIIGLVFVDSYKEYCELLNSHDD